MDFSESMIKVINSIFWLVENFNLIKNNLLLFYTLVTAFFCSKKSLFRPRLW
jgi:hypothetical protein